ncbi:MAG: UDP-glucose 4-epimerase [Acidimicrobiaceae bacterium]|nr:UDP-glucose 4-epimerase [Acidimicrobiaceae bacterium]
MRRALVTGATGFIGGHLVRALAREGWEVHALVRPSSAASGLSAEVHVDDGTAEGLASVMAAANPDVVFHLAALFLAAHQPADVPALVEANVAFGARVAEALAGLGGHRLLVATGTAWQHYEGRAYSPVALYAATKQALADVLRYYADAGQLSVTVLKLFDTYGPDDPRRKLLRLLADAAVSGETLEMSGGEQLIDLLHVDDVVAALLHAVDRNGDAGGTPYLEFAVSSGAPVPLRTLVETFNQATGRTVNVTWGARPYRPREMFTPWEAGPPLPGWKPEVALADGIRATYGTPA